MATDAEFEHQPREYLANARSGAMGASTLSHFHRMRRSVHARSISDPRVYGGLLANEYSHQRAGRVNPGTARVEVAARRRWHTTERGIGLFQSRRRRVGAAWRNLLRLWSALFLDCASIFHRSLAPPLDKA